MLKPIIRSLARNLGYEILGPPRAYADQITLRGLLHRENINLILDVGANVGQFVHAVHESGYQERIISFEPQASEHAQLLALAAPDPNWTIADRTALGADAGFLTMHRSSNSQSSSILPMLASHSDAEPRAGYIDTEQVQVNRLDDVCTLAPSDRVLLKIDVQGYEKPVLDGARRILESCRAVLIEMSLIPLYEGQMLARPLWDMLEEVGFEAWSFEPGFRSPRSGRLLQLDGLFVRRNGSME
ncbi:MAG: FkbM family methyltransferase [Acidobacteriota bacterium]|nr:FkbM family methyltransferase [Acidobacteriota bacterium]